MRINIPAFAHELLIQDTRSLRHGWFLTVTECQIRYSEAGLGYSEAGLECQMRHSVKAVLDP